MQKLTKEQAIIVSAYTGFLICEFSDLHDAIEKKLGHAVWTHEMAAKQFWEELREAFCDDFLALSPEEE